MQRRAFSLVELLVVIAIISLLAALLVPVFWTVQGRARQISCLSNLHQIGAAVAMYSQDYDGRFPHAVDPSDKRYPGSLSGYPDFESEIPHLPLIQEVLRPYTESPTLFRCPGDIGFTDSDFTGLAMDALPTSFEKSGTSYYYRTEFAATKATESVLSAPEKLNLVFDAAGHWHGTLIPLEKRYNVLFADSHVKNISAEQINDAWATHLISK